MDGPTTDGRKEEGQSTRCAPNYLHDYVDTPGGTTDASINAKLVGPDLFEGTPLFTPSPAAGHLIRLIF